MIFNISNKTLLEINKLFEIDEGNRINADFINDCIENGSKIAKTSSKNQDSLFEKILNFYECGQDFKKKMKEIGFDKRINKLDVNLYNDNPYTKKISSANINYKNYKIVKKRYQPYQCFLYRTIEIDELNNEKTYLGYFDKEFEYLTLCENQSTWMLITPHEINTMQPAINDASGNVITFGLGLGYFAYMVSLKSNVNSVTIVEKNKDIIEIFKNYLLPQFENKEKIKIINSDANNFIEKEKFNYDFAFVDLWFDTLDGLPFYIKFLKKESCYPNTRFEYWIEESMLIMARRCLITLLYEEINENKMPYDSTDNFYDELINHFYFLLKDYNISSFKDVTSLLDKKNIIRLLKEY